MPASMKQGILKGSEVISEIINDFKYFLATEETVGPKFHSQSH